MDASGSRHGNHMKPLELFEGKDIVKICAPMVRYSRLSFRSLVRKYDCDLVFTPMIVSSSFICSSKARDVEFTTNSEDRPLIVQFAANSAKDLADASEIIYPYADGVDLNCGCPQRWAQSEGYGSNLINKPDLVQDMIKQTRNRISDNDFTVSMKIRIHWDIRKTVELCRKAEHAGLSWLTVHGRTPDERKEPVHADSIRIIKDSVNVPVVANGDIFNLKDAITLQKETGVRGVMSARGLLHNPALFTGQDHTPWKCISDWLKISLTLGTPFTTFHHHLIFMLEKLLPRSEKRVFNSLSSTSAVMDYLDEYLNL